MIRDDIRAGNFNCQFDIAQAGRMATVVETCPGDEILNFTADVDPRAI